MRRREDLWTWILHSTSRIAAIDEVSLPRDPRVLASLREAAGSATTKREGGLPYFRAEPFDPRLAPHKIQKLSARYGRIIYAAEIEANLRAAFYIERDIVVTVDIGSHDIYRG